MSSVQLHLLGQFRLQREEGAVVAIVPPRVQSLLAYLALHREAPQARQHIAFLFWPDSSESQARTNLRRLLHDLHAALPDVDHYLILHNQWLQWRPDALFRVDVSQFEEGLAEAERLLQNQARAEAIACLEQAVDLYHGPFLRDSYEEWALATRTALDERFARALQKLAELQEAQRNYAAAIGYGQRLLRHDPLRESTYQHLMRLHALNGDRAAALRLYHECVTTLARELGVEVSAATHAAHTQLLNAEVHGTPPPTEVTRPATGQDVVGRQQEWQQLLQVWNHARQGHAQVVALTGEAGIGKTHLAQNFATWVRRQGMPSLETRAYEAEGGLTFAPIIELLRTEPLVTEVAQLDATWIAPIASLLPELREKFNPLPAPDPVGEALQRQHFYEVLTRAVLGPGRNSGRDKQPRLLLIDDMQWCDRDTIEWLRYLLRFAPQERLLVLLTVRSGEAAAEHPLHSFLLALRSQRLLTQIKLGRLNQEETAILAANLAGRCLVAGQAYRLYGHTEGNPFFVVEMVRANLAYWSAGGDDAPNANEFDALRERWSSQQSLPDRVQAVILARLSQLSLPTQEVVRFAATIGRSFSLDFLACAGGYSEDELVASLDELWQHHIVVEQGANEYDFSHPLIRSVAYSQLSPIRRSVGHRRIAQSLEARDSNEADSSAGLTAIHYELAGEIGNAVNAYRRAARFAMQAYAYVEAATTVRKALMLLDSLPNSPARDSQAVELYLELGSSLMAANGWTDHGAQEAYDRALVLCAASQKPSALEVSGQETPPLFDTRIFEAFWGLHEIHLFRGNREKAVEASDLCWALAQRSRDPEMMLQAHHAYWGLYFFFNVVPRALQAVVAHAQRGIDLYVPQWHHEHLRRFGGHNPAACGLEMKGKALWLLGYPDQALESACAAVAMSMRLQHPFTIRQALCQQAKIHFYRGEAGAALTCTEKAREHYTDHPQPWYAIDHVVLRTWALMQLGQTEVDAALAHKACSHRESEGEQLEMPFYLAILAEIYEHGGEIEHALEVIRHAQAVAAMTQEDHYLPEIHRLAGKYLLATGERAAAQSSFLLALEIAKAQAAKAHELRAALSLSQLWAEQGERTRAYALLAGVYNWFTEGFDTADLRAAQALLQTLAPSQTPTSS